MSNDLEDKKMENDLLVIFYDLPKRCNLQVIVV